MRNLILMVALFILGSSSAIMIPLSEVRVNGTVYADLDVNGMRDEGELGLQYIRITVLDENDSEVAHTSTDENGYYRTTVNCVHGVQLWVTAVAPEGMHHTRDVRYEFTCQDEGSIYSLFGLAGTRCAWSYDCAAEEYCTSGLCMPLTCGEGAIPHNHECIPEPECTSPADCGYNETCEAFVCVPLYCAGLEGYTIENHKCHAIVPEAECTVNEDCAFDEMCSDGSCVKVVCPENFKVQNHYCLYVPPEVPEEAPEEVTPEKPPEKNVTEVPEEEKPPVQPGENVTVGIPEGEAPAEGIPDIVLVALIIAVAAVAITYMVIGRKKGI